MPSLLRCYVSHPIESKSHFVLLPIQYHVDCVLKVSQYLDRRLQVVHFSRKKVAPAPQCTRERGQFKLRRNSFERASGEREPFCSSINMTNGLHFNSNFHDPHLKFSFVFQQQQQHLLQMFSLPSPDFIMIMFYGA